MKIEYRVKQVTRYIVTKYVSDHEISEGVGCSASSTLCGEFQNVVLANRIAKGLAESELKGPLEDPWEVYYQLQGLKVGEDALPLQKV